MTSASHAGLARLCALPRGSITPIDSAFSDCALLSSGGALHSTWMPGGMLPKICEMRNAAPIFLRRNSTYSCSSGVPRKTERSPDGVGSAAVPRPSEEGCDLTHWQQYATCHATFTFAFVD